MGELLQLARQLRPSALDDHGLFSAIMGHARRFSADTGIKTDVNTHGEHAMLETDQEIAVYRIAQEALNNVAQHAEAEKVEIDLSTERGGGVYLRVRDDGRGFDPSHQNGGLGLGGMAERARLVGGRLEINSTPGRGTELSLVVP
jgi:two-component system sensor histidine kinase UhpB